MSQNILDKKKYFLRFSKIKDKFIKTFFNVGSYYKLIYCNNLSISEFLLFKELDVQQIT